MGQNGKYVITPALPQYNSNTTKQHTWGRGEDGLLSVYEVKSQVHQSTECVRTMVITQWREG